MRTTLLSFILLFIFTSAHAQYSPMLTTGSEWHHYAWFESSCNGILRVTEDSLLNGVNYKKIQSVGNPCVHELHLMREDTMTRQVFLWRGNNTEIVIYDFSLEAGDTLFLDPSFTANDLDLIVDSITYSLPDNTSCGDNEYPITTLENPKVFHLRFTVGGKVLWVEGIGNLADPVWSVFEWDPGNLSDQVLCHYNAEGVKDYQDLSSFCDDPSDCLGPVSSIRNIAPNNGLRLYPNPAHDEIRLEILDDQLGQLARITFYNAAGYVLKQEALDGNKAINIAALPPGLIIGIVQTKTGERYSLKFVKQ